MKISTKGRYGIKAVMELARRYGDGPISIRELAEKAEISSTYLEQLFKKLREAKIVDAARGAYGGYVLSKPPQSIPVGSVIRTLEGSIAPMVCAEEGFSCKNSDTCIEAFLYRRIRESVDEVIDHITLQDMLFEEMHMEKKGKILSCRRKQ